ncbi:MULTISPECIES: hypothetical protein [Cupriavidus]|uniref:Uncharacterized protein n=1 Tax=Cupriavidus pauculus TaxID=82633 RepID=A0A5P2H2E5_9BURK|nr:hypothetical protein [Cupriavidus pauculus]QET02026.1 hypothetical protein FOB72_08190 [Cupriavidus pauculus]
MFVCQNQPCGAQWQPSEVTIKNEGQGFLFRCPMCGARNPVQARQKRDGTIEYRQSRRESPSAEPERPRGRRH